MKTKFLKEKADAFLENGQEQLKKGIYFIAAFNFEQAAQLYIKHCLFLQLKDFPKIHPIDKLLEEFGKGFDKQREVDEFYKENVSVISDLNQSYITSRYLPVDFTLYQVQEMEKFIERLIKFLEEICQEL